MFWGALRVVDVFGSFSVVWICVVQSKFGSLHSVIMTIVLLTILKISRLRVFILTQLTIFSKQQKLMIIF